MSNHFSGLTIAESKQLWSGRNIFGLVTTFMLFFHLLPRGRNSDRTGLGLLSQAFRRDILQIKLY